MAEKAKDALGVDEARCGGRPRLLQFSEEIARMQPGRHNAVTLPKPQTSGMPRLRAASPSRTSAILPMRMSISVPAGQSA